MTEQLRDLSKGLLRVAFSYVKRSSALLFGLAAKAAGVAHPSDECRRCKSYPLH